MTNEEDGMPDEARIMTGAGGSRTIRDAALATAESLSL